MCGIAGIIDLTGRRQPEAAVLQAMAQSLWHRGPDDDGFLIRQGFGFANRRLSIVGLGDGYCAGAQSPFRRPHPLARRHRHDETNRRSGRITRDRGA